ncbi:phage/plasmid primase, P4 family [Streptomyces sp. NPDC048604]|uniref:DNA primase family protein n=1 Tax=Streptomyces sp. NPDC048604 TaxID=3365578 RepID=UPI0037229DEC
MSEPDKRPIPLQAVPQHDEELWWGNEEPPDHVDQGDAKTPVKDGDGSLTDAILADQVSSELLAGRFCWAAGLGWMRWDGKRWDRCDEVSVIEVVRQYIVEEVNRELPKVSQDWRARAALTSLLGRNRINAITSLARGIVEENAEAFDSHPDLLNTPTGIVDLRTGELSPHDPAKLLTKITTVGYRPGARHDDWDAALMACPQDCHAWLQIRVGQGLTGYMTPDDTMVLLKGGGENGKSTVMGTLMEAAGGYHVLVSDRVLMADPGAHPTELMDFRGARLAVAEELPEARRMSVKRLKDAVGTPRMKARYIRQNNVEWEATHSLFLSTNYLPIIEETDHGTWRRLQLLTFPYKFLKPHEPLTGAPNELRGDPSLRQRLKEGREQRQAALAWAVEGARQWYASQRVLPEPPARVAADTRKWRAESDLILGYWSERIVPAPDNHVMSQDLLDDFNTWLRTHNHQKWSDKTFYSRFASHDETTKHRVEKRQVRLDPSLSRPPIGEAWDEPHRPTPMRYAAWLGVRFRTAADDEEVSGEAESSSNKAAA